MSRTRWAGCRPFEELGEITARMHRHARAWPRPSGFTRFHWDWAAAFGAGAGGGAGRTVGQLAAGDEAEIRTFIMFRRLLLVAWIGSHRGGRRRRRARRGIHQGQL